MEGEKIETLMDIMLHHEGTSKKNDDGILVYSLDSRNYLGDLDEDTLDVFFVRNYYKELGYDKVVQFWWLPLGRSLEGKLRALMSDDELIEMCFHIQRNDGFIDVYFEHGMSTLDLLVGKEVVICLDDGEEYPGEGDLVSKKNTSKGSKSNANTSTLTKKPNPKYVSFSNSSYANTNANTSPISNSIPNPPDTNTDHIPNPPNTNSKPILKPKDNPKPKSKPNSTSISKPKLNQKPIKKPNPNLKPKLKENTSSKEKAKVNPNLKSKFKYNPLWRITRSQAIRTYKGYVNKGNEALHVDLTVNDNSSDDDSLEDSSFKSMQEDSSSSEDNFVATISIPRNKELRNRKRSASVVAKEKEKIMQPNDSLVVDVSDGEVDLVFLGTP
ncbi:hypothetical protein Ahy_A02g007243 [Arachis hypogaea]|uniref:PB1-like domain-containing protein n=1 Tax=Arachis hypogaea TaxID=3818 RepID=A0A445EBS8_ARAHY|nr:hypothetical protein Ahy_A02g007243 [Arachis hypogaea]